MNKKRTKREKEKEREGLKHKILDTVVCKYCQ